MDKWGFFMRHFIIAILMIIFIWVLSFSMLNYSDFGIVEDELVVIEDNDKLIELIEKNTPVKIEISDIRWGKAVIKEPEILYKFWNILSNLEPYPDKYISNQDQINGYIYFIDGSRQYFTISDRFQIGDFLLSDINEEINVKELYRILQHTLQTKTNLINMIKKADSVYLYKSGDFYDPESREMIIIKGEFKEKFIDYISGSFPVKESERLNELLYSRGYQAIYYIALSFETGEEQDPIIFSVISHDFFNIMDTSLLNRNMVYFEGYLLDFCNEMFAMSSMNL